MTRFDQRHDVRLYCARGEKLPQAKLKAADVAQIRSEFVPYCRIRGARALAKRFGIHVNTVWKITARESWAHVRAN